MVVQEEVVILPLNPAQMNVLIQGKCNAMEIITSNLVEITTETVAWNGVEMIIVIMAVQEEVVIVPLKILLVILILIVRQMIGFLEQKLVLVVMCGRNIK